VRRFSLLAIGVLAACSKGLRIPEATRTDSAGVEIVMNSGVDRALTWRVLATDTLFDPASDTTLQGEARALRVRADAGGRLFFIDGASMDRRFLRQDLDGSIRQIGRKGDGPGEYQMAGDVAIAADGEALLMDYAKQAFVHFDPGGAPLANVPWAAFGQSGTRGSIRSAGFAGGGFVLVRGDGTDSTSTLRLLLARTTDTTELIRLKEPLPTMVNFESCRIGVGLMPRFSPTILWSGNTRLVAAAAGDGYRIDIWEGGDLVRSIRRDLPARAATKALALQDLGEGMRISLPGTSNCLIPAADLIEKGGFAPTVPAVKQLSTAPDGTLWVERHTIRGEPMQRDVFDPTGTYLGTIIGDVPWPQAWLPDGRFVAVNANTDSLPVVVRYAVGGAVRRE
jgi:hypothetical protein